MLRSMALEFIQGIRRIAPGMGGQKLFTMYVQFMESRQAPRMGRDQFYLLLDEAGLKRRRKRRKPQSTDSPHGLPTNPNLAWDFLPTAPNQLWAADITYIELRPSPGHTRFAYLALILDCHTEEIVGWATRWRLRIP